MWDRFAALALVFALGCGDQVVGTFLAESGSTGPQTGVADPSTGIAPDAESTSAATTASDTTAASADADATTAAPADDTSGSIPELCDGLDNDLDGLVDEIGPDTSTCGGCTLLQGAGQAWWACDLETSWSDAQAWCEGLGAGLALVKTPEDTAFVLDALIGTSMFYWLGAREDPDLEGEWTWVDATPVAAYTNWAGTQPDDFEAAQDCMRLTFGIVDAGWFDGAWDDFYCDFPTAVLCSAPHAP